MASKSSLLQKWHLEYHPSASGIPLKMAWHPAYQKKGGGGSPSYISFNQNGRLLYMYSAIYVQFVFKAFE